MQQSRINRVTLQGVVGPPTVRLSPIGPIFASAELIVAELPTITITVAGIGIDAAGIAECRDGDILRVEGSLAFDHPEQSFYVFANEVRRMVPRGGALVPEAPSIRTFDKFERVFLDETAPVSAPAS